MDASEINDSKSLQAWSETRPKADSVIIAYRIALRLAPDIYSSVSFRQSRRFDLTALVNLRCLLTAAVAGNASTPAVMAAARAAYAPASAESALDAADAAARAAYAPFSAETAARAADRATRAAYAAASAAYAAADATARSGYAAASATDTAACAADAAALQSGTNPLTLPLWHKETPPDWFTTAEAAMRDYWATNLTHWAFWQRWYDDATAGRPLDWQLQHEIALIPDYIWRSGPGPVAEAIAKIEGEHNQRPPEHPLTTELRTLPKPSASQITTTQAAMEQNRTILPPTFDAIEGLILLEIERLQQRNYTDDLDQAEALRQIRVFLTLYDAICALRAQLPATAPVTEEQAEKSVSLVSLYTKKFAELPREKADEVVEGFWTAGRGAVQATLIGTTTLLGVSYGLPALAAVTIGTMVFAPKKAADLVKAAREALTPKP
jgi:hypothetical protein